MPIKFQSKLPAALKAEVEQTFGRRVFSSKDCILLSLEIFSKTKEQVNVNTLRRLFGLVQANYNPSVSTLNIMAKYCGFSSFEEVPEISIENDEIEFVPREEIIRYLANVLEEMPLQDVLNPTFFIFFKHMILLFGRNPSLAKAFQNHLVKAKTGHTFYFEHFINIDKLNDFYGDGLRHYVNEKRTKEAECHANSLLVFRYWLTAENEKLNKIFANLYDFQAEKSINASICARYFSAHLYHAHANNLLVEKVINEIQKFHFSLCIQREQTQPFPFFEYIVSEALVLTGYYNEALYYINFASENYFKNLTYSGFGYYQAFDLLKAMALLRVEQKRYAENILNHINTHEFGFLSKKFNCILYISLLIQFNKASQSEKEELKVLVAETGFKKIYNIFRFGFSAD